MRCNPHQIQRQRPDLAGGCRLRHCLLHQIQCAWQAQSCGARRRAIRQDSARKASMSLQIQQYQTESRDTSGAVDLVGLLTDCSSTFEFRLHHVVLFNMVVSSSVLLRDLLHQSLTSSAGHRQPLLSGGLEVFLVVEACFGGEKSCGPYQASCDILQNVAKTIAEEGKQRPCTDSFECHCQTTSLELKTNSGKGATRITETTSKIRGRRRCLGAAESELKDSELPRTNFSRFELKRHTITTAVQKDFFGAKRALGCSWPRRRFDSLSGVLTLRSLPCHL